LRSRSGWIRSRLGWPEWSSVSSRSNRRAGCLRGVAVKDVPSQRVASVRYVIPAYDRIDRLRSEIFSYLGQHRINPVGPPVALYHGKEFREQDADVGVVVPVAGSIPDGNEVKERTLPGGEVACAVHEGSYDAIGGTYGEVMAWIEDNGYRITGAPREMYLTGPESGDDPSTFVTEIQVPVQKGMA
jgi:effector-binding domain-containing protein